MRRVLVTGATGFLGAHVAKAFLDASWQVVGGKRAVSDPWRLHKVLAPEQPHLQWVVLNLCDHESISAALEKIQPEVIVNCAAYGVDYRQQDMQTAFQVNILGTAQLVCESRRVGVGAFVHVGTYYEYGHHPMPVSEEAGLRPCGIYGSTKAAGSLLALERAATLGLPLVVIRPSSIYGPLEGRHKFVPQVIEASLHNQRLELTPGEQIRDCVYVDDVAKACVRMAEMADFPKGEILNLGCGQGLSMRAFGNAIAKACASVGNSDDLQWGARPYREDEIMHLVSDSSRASRLLGWHAETLLHEGIRRTLRYSRDNEVPCVS